MTKREPRRKKLGASRGVSLRHCVFRIAEGLEIDDVDHFSVRRRRVFFEDVVLVTLHSSVARAHVIVHALLAFIVLGIAIACFTADAPEGGWVFVAIASPFVVFALLHLTARTHTVTVFGRRTRARIDVRFSRAKAQRRFEELSMAASSRQREIRSEIAAADPLVAPPPASPEAPPAPDAAPSAAPAEAAPSGLGDRYGVGTAE